MNKLKIILTLILLHLLLHGCKSDVFNIKAKKRAHKATLDELNQSLDWGLPFVEPGADYQSPQKEKKQARIESTGFVMPAPWEYAMI